MVPRPRLRGEGPQDPAFTQDTPATPLPTWMCTADMIRALFALAPPAAPPPAVPAAPAEEAKAAEEAGGGAAVDDQDADMVDDDDFFADAEDDDAEDAEAAEATRARGGPPGSPKRQRASPLPTASSVSNNRALLRERKTFVILVAMAKDNQCALVNYDDLQRLPVQHIVREMAENWALDATEATAATPKLWAIVLAQFLYSQRPDQQGEFRIQGSRGRDNEAAAARLQLHALADYLYHNYHNRKVKLAVGNEHQTVGPSRCTEALQTVRAPDVEEHVPEVRVSIGSVEACKAKVENTVKLLGMALEDLSRKHPCLQGVTVDERIEAMQAPKVV